MRSITEYITARIFQLKFKHFEEFVQKNPAIKRPTFFKLLKDGVENSQPRTLEPLAIARKFREWSDLLKGWQADDVMWGLYDLSDMPLNMPPIPTTKPTMPKTRAEKIAGDMTPDDIELLASELKTLAAKHRQKITGKKRRS